MRRRALAAVVLTVVVAAVGVVVTLRTGRTQDPGHRLEAVRVDGTREADGVPRAPGR